MDTPFDTDWLFQYLPNLQKLYLTRSTDTIQLWNNGHPADSPDYYKTVWKHPDQDIFDDVPVILKYFPKLQLTVRMIVDERYYDAQGNPVMTKRVSSVGLLLSF